MAARGRSRAARDRDRRPVKFLKSFDFGTRMPHSQIRVKFAKATSTALIRENPAMPENIPKLEAQFRLRRHQIALET